MGCPEDFAITGHPHSGQKPRLAMLPLSAVVLWYFGSPFVIRNAAPGTNSADAYALPLALWQSLQWQLSAIMGSAEHS
jgi:hypothetical protein